MVSRHEQDPMQPITDISDLIRLSRDAVREPRAVAAVLLRAALPREALWLMFCLIIVSAMFFAQLLQLLITDGSVELVMGPVSLGILQGMMLFGMTIAIHRLGRLFGGTGDFEGALTLVTFHQFVLMLLQIINFIALIVFPPLSLLVQVVSLALFFWLLVNFIAELHGFRNLGQVFFGVLIVTLLVFLLLRQLSGMAGMSAPV